jgi:hypothetical protein
VNSHLAARIKEVRKMCEDGGSAIAMTNAEASALVRLALQASKMRSALIRIRSEIDSHADKCANGQDLPDPTRHSIDIPDVIDDCVCIYCIAGKALRWEAE